jgi:hypothetical protein
VSSSEAVKLSCVVPSNETLELQSMEHMHTRHAYVCCLLTGSTIKVVRVVNGIWLLLLDRNALLLNINEKAALRGWLPHTFKL